jgi:ubiquinone biosynthesis protein UbiJ
MKPLIEKILQKALNRYIALDPESKKQLQLLQGKIATLNRNKVHRFFNA